MYLDQGITIAGSGFRTFEPVTVRVSLGSGANASLGVADSNGGGAWMLTVNGPLTNLTGIADNMSRLLAADVVTIMADGADGSKASWPVGVIAEMPVAADPPSTGVSLVVAPVVAGEAVTVYGAGFGPKERFSLVAVTGIGKGTSYGKQGQEYGFFDKGTLAPSGVFERYGLTLGVAEETGAFMVSISPTQAPGIYTLEAVGVEDSYATAPLIILAAPQ